MEKGIDMTVLQSDENETEVGGMFLIPKSIGKNSAIMELMKSLSRQHHRQAFWKRFTIVSGIKLIHQSDLPREVRSQSSLSNQTFYFV
jgi:hypothetical protein